MSSNAFHCCLPKPLLLQPLFLTSPRRFLTFLFPAPFLVPPFPPLQVLSTFSSQLLSPCCSPLLCHVLHTPLLCTPLSHSPPFPLNPPLVFLPSDPSAQTSQTSPLQGLSVDVLLSPFLPSSTRQKRLKTLSLYIH